MTTQLKTPLGSADTSTVRASLVLRDAAPYHLIAWTSEDRLKRIVTMGQQINGYIEFLSQPSDRNGTSNEARDKAIADFYERIVIMERQLVRIYDDLRLG